MLSKDLMKRDVECLSPQDTAEMASRKMRDANIGFLPVCDSSGRVVGTLTDRDIAIRLVADNKPPSTRVEALMSKELVACKPEDDVKKAAQLMGQHKKSRIICVDD